MSRFTFKKVSQRFIKANLKLLLMFTTTPSCYAWSHDRHVISEAVFSWIFSVTIVGSFEMSENDADLRNCDRRLASALHEG